MAAQAQLDATLSPTDIVLEFLEACIHQVLYARGIYPASIFDKRIKYGMMVHQSRHPEINGYVRRVLGNTKPLMEVGIVDDLVMAFSPEDANSQEPKEKIVFSCSALAMIRSGENWSMRYGDNKALDNLEEHMKNSLVNLLKLPKFSEVEPWKFELQVHTGKSSRGVDPNQDNALKNALRTNEWKVDNEAGAGPSASQRSRDDSNVASFIGVSSFHSELFNCAINRVRDSR
jgi:hypothetical protein